MCEGIARDGSTSQRSKTCTFFVMFIKCTLTHCVSTIITGIQFVVAVQSSIIHKNQAEVSELTGMV